MIDILPFFCSEVKMRKVILYIAQSLDGKIADSTGSISWLGGESPDYTGDYGYSKLIKDIDTVLLGYRTYHQIVSELSPGSWPYPEQNCFVFTHHPLPDEPSIHFLSESPEVFVRRLAEQPGKNIWVCGGAKLISSLVCSDCIDEYWIATMPILLGKGIPLFSYLPSSLSLHLEEVTSENGVILSRYSCKR